MVCFYNFYFKSFLIQSILGRLDQTFEFLGEAYFSFECLYFFWKVCMIKILNISLMRKSFLLYGQKDSNQVYGEYRRFWNFLRRVILPNCYLAPLCAEPSKRWAFQFSKIRYQFWNSSTQTQKYHDRVDVNSLYLVDLNLISPNAAAWAIA